MNYFPDQVIHLFLIEYVIYFQRVLSMRCLKDALYALLEVSKTSLYAIDVSKTCLFLKMSFVCYECLKDVFCIASLDTYVTNFVASFVRYEFLKDGCKNSAK